VSAAEALSAACQSKQTFEVAQNDNFANGVQTSKAVAGSSSMNTVSAAAAAAAAAEQQTWAAQLILRSNSCRFSPPVSSMSAIRSW